MDANTYQAILFHPDGDFVTDFRNRETKQEVWDEINDMGSRWIFYPISFVATDKTIVDAPEGFEFFKGKRIKTVSRILAKFTEELCEAINKDYPVHHIDFEFAY